MTVEDKQFWVEEATDALRDANQVMDRLLAANARYQDACKAALTELEERHDRSDESTCWMARHILNLKNALPPTISKQIVRKADSIDQQNKDFAQSIWNAGVASVKAAQVAYR